MKQMFCLFASLLLTAAAQSPLPDTLPLQPNPDFSAAMVAGLDQFLLCQTEQAKAARAAQWPGDVAAHRAHLRAIIGAVDQRLLCTALELIGSTSAPALLAETDDTRIFRVRWPVFAGVHGEGLLLQPKDPPRARVIYLPDADVQPEDVAATALRDYAGCEVVIPALISRGSGFSGNRRFNVTSNVPHREWIYRQGFIQGRHIIGYEVQKVMALLDCFAAQREQAPTVVAGTGEGGLLALYAGALDTRIGAVAVRGYFGPREGLWSEPIYRNLQGLLREFGDAEIAALIAPRPLVIQHADYPLVQGPPATKPGQRAIAAPGKIEMPALAEVQAEVRRAQAITPGDWIKLCTEQQSWQAALAGLLPKSMGGRADVTVRLPVDESRQERLVRELENFSQSLLVEGEATRGKNFWKPAPLNSLAAFQTYTAQQRQHFWNDVIGRLPDPNVPPQARSRLVKETDKVRIYEVTLDVWEGVFAWGWLALPKNLKAGERRPVVVCQHGLEGLPENIFDTDEKSGNWKAYKAFALRLAEAGYITFAPHNPYRGHDAFRTLQRKANPLGLTLFSFIIGQHQRMLEWLRAQPFTDTGHIAFYGLSYGGKSALRIPAVLTDYCLSICSGDFNEWVRKCADTSMPMCYVFTPEYEIWEWNLGGTFNYAEMAALIAPRPFMVERGHNDGVGLDEWVNYEFAKVRRLYDKLGLGDRASIEHFDGPHTINGRGTFELLRKECPLPQATP